MTALVQVSAEGGVVTLTLNNPGQMNVFSRDMRDALIAQFESLQDDDTCRAIVLTGAAGHFTAGGDMNGFHENTALAVRRRLEQGSTRLMRLMIAGRKPVVAAVEGNCYGAGLSLACACDQVVVARDAKLCAAFIRIGFLPDLALLWTLPRRVGLGKAKELAGLAPVIDGAEAVAIRLGDHLAEPGGALAAAQALAARYAAMPPLATAMLKSAWAEGLEAVLAHEANVQPSLIGSPEHLEAKRAFLSKRKPDFAAAAARPAFETD